MDVIDTNKAFLRDHKKTVTISLLCLGGLLVVFLIALLVYGYRSHYAYRPIKSCDLLPISKAMDLLGNKVIKTDANAPVISGNTATSQCSYSDENPDQNQMRVIALAVQSAINSTGTAKMHDTFVDSETQSSNKKISGLGSDAFFVPSLGQLNVFDGHVWLKLSYGIGANPQANDLNQSVKIAKSVLQNIPKK